MNTMTATPRVYVADLAAYNAGTLKGAWIDLGECPTFETIMETIMEALAPAGEEWRFDDYDNLPYNLHEYAPVSELVAIAEQFQEFERDNVTASVTWLDYCSAYREGCVDSVEQFLASIIGVYDTWLDYVWEVIENDERIHDEIKSFVDVEKYAGDLDMNGTRYIYREGDAERNSDVLVYQAF